MKTVSLSLLVVFALFGNQVLSATTLSSLSSVRLDSSPTAPKHFLYMGTTDAVVTGILGGIFAPVGGAVGAGVAGAAATSAAAGPDKEGALLQSKLHKRGFYIEKHFKKDFDNELKKAGIFKKIVSSGSAEGAIDITLTRYGIKVAPTGFKRLKPLIHAQISVNDKSGKVIFKDNVQVNENDGFVRGASYEEYLADMGHLEKDFKILSKELAKEAVKEMKRSKNKKAGESSSKVKRSPIGTK
ncbi:MAG: hypothetical protein AAF558_03260 [Verrucomicrobiota bacterium]